MKIPIVKGCCCRCLNNREGSIVIAVLGLVHAISVVLTNLPHLVRMSLISVEFHMSENIYAKITDAAVSAVFIIMNSLLIHGIRKSNRKLMIPWLCAALLLLVLMVLAAVALIVLAVVVSGGDSYWTVSLVVTGVALLVFCPVGAHFFLVVYAYFKELENAEMHGEDREKVRLEEGIHKTP
ncbi:unnamed protein product [Darwinula stevensoni]|uniref:DUF7027 domain-containing protein n=1 Tax=Darwinula stevensoni TaxID=69355 RepID=A0A7R9A7X8_9CRUS|nr:unnamed protein product [Darwinula stevensoni]CAG0893976.1 unnamed protein product [Darwinula stevensoni]